MQKFGVYFQFQASFDALSIFIIRSMGYIYRQLFTIPENFKPLSWLVLGRCVGKMTLRNLQNHQYQKPEVTSYLKIWQYVATMMFYDSLSISCKSVKKFLRFIAQKSQKKKKKRITRHNLVSIVKKSRFALDYNQYFAFAMSKKWLVIKYNWKG